MSHLILLFVLLALMTFASGSSCAFLLTTWEYASAHFSFGTWFFLGCCVLYISQHACHAFSSSITVVSSLILELAKLYHDTTLAAMRADVRTLKRLNNTAASQTHCSERSDHLLGQNKKLQSAYNASQADVDDFRSMVEKMSAKLSMYERHYNAKVVDDDRLACLRQIRKLKQELMVKDDEIVNLHDTISEHKKSAVHSSNALHSLAGKNDELKATLEAKTKRITELEPIVLQHGRDIYQRDMQVAKFSSFKEILHQMVEAGGDKMVIAVLFLRCLDEKGLDIAELGVEESRFLTYYEHAVATARGVASSLLPQGKWL